MNVSIANAQDYKSPPAKMGRMDLLSRLWVRQMGGETRTLPPLQRRPRVSVIVPCYNYGRYLAQCVGSVLTNQPGVDVEVIIVDDKSSDDSLHVARAMAARDHRIRVMAHRVNTGAITTYNDGLNDATGDYVVLLSADDLMTPGALTRAAQVFESAPTVGLVYGRALDFTEPAPAQSSHRPRGSKPALPPSRNGAASWILWPGSQWLKIRCRSGYNVISSPEAVMRTSILRTTGLYRHDLPHASDFQMWLQTAMVSDVGFLFGADQAYYRKHASNMHKTTFKSGSYQGDLIDLEQRWKSFETVFSARERMAPDMAELFETARRAMARNALQTACYAFARGFEDFPVSAFEAFATEVYPQAAHTAHGRAVARRKRLGMSGLPIHPLWAAPAASLRVSELARRWRRRRIGV